MSTAESAVHATVSPLLRDALSFEAPYVVERLVKDRVVGDPDEGRELFTEILRYLVLCGLHRDVVVGMFSARVDEAWHAFILYTTEYTDFCMRFFGRYVGHAPKNAPPADTHDHLDRRELTFDEFRERYQNAFDEPLPDVWYDVRSITPARRVFNDSATNMTVTQHDSITELIDDCGTVILSANAIAYDALLFIAQTGAFYVRELPGGLTDDEKVNLIKTLTSWGLLRVAP